MLVGIQIPSHNYISLQSIPPTPIFHQIYIIIFLEIKVMKIFSWIRSKRNGTNEGDYNINPNPHPKSYHIMQQQQSCKEEFSDWPNGLLAIGTFGNTKHSDNNNVQDHTTTTTTTAQDLEEVDRDLRLLLKEKKSNLSVEQLLESLNDGGDEADLERVRSVVERGRQDAVKSDKRKRGIGKKSLCFLMKKLLLCGAPPPIIRDPAPPPHSKLDHSTMEKILRAMLHKKIYPQRPTTPPNIKYLDQGCEHDEDEEEACTDHTSKWVKTDSEYIVLEI